jgi:two-component sensor histidine kinase
MQKVVQRLRVVTVATVAGLCVLGFSAALLASLSRSTALVEHALEVEVGVVGIYSGLNEAATAYRGYATSGDAAYLEQFEAASARLNETLLRLQVLEPDRGREGEELDRAVRERLTQMRAIVEVTRHDGTDAAKRRLQDPQYEATRFASVSEMRHKILDFDGRAKAELARRRATASNTKAAAFAGLFTSMIALVFAAVIAWRSRAIVTVEKKVTDRELATMQAMLQEIHHRVKNNLQMISSLLSLQSRQSPHEEARLAFQDAQSRVRSIALLHESLYQSDDLGRIDMQAYVNRLLDTLQHAYGQSRVRATFDVAIEGVFLPVDVAVPCGLIVNELVTNALKHAFRVPDAASNEVRIAMRRVGESLAISVADNGVGFAGIDPASKQTMGLTLVRDLSTQLRGRVEFTNAATARGAECSITFPAAALGS